MASSSSIKDVTVEVGDACPYPHQSNLSATSFISVKLSGRDEYDMWKTQMICLLKSHGMYGFIDGTIVSPQTSVSRMEKVGDVQNHSLWSRSDAIVKGWILGSLSKQTLGYVLNRVTKKLHQGRNEDDFSAKDVWDELQTIYGRVVPSQLQTTCGPAVYSQLEVADEQEEKRRAYTHQSLYRAILAEDWYHFYDIIFSNEVTVIDKITNNGNTALHVAVGATKKPLFLENMLGLTPDNTKLLDLRNSDGSTLLHVAAIVGNTEAAKILVERNPDLLLAKDNEGHTPLALALSNMHTETAQHLLQHINTRLQKETLFSGTSGDELLVTAISSKDFGFANDMMKHCTALHSDAVLMAVAQNFPCELGTFEKYIGTDIIRDRVDAGAYGAISDTVDRCLPLRGSWISWVDIIIRVQLIFMLLLMIPKILVWPFIKERIRNHDDGGNLLRAVCLLIIDSTNPTSRHHYYTNPVFEATRQNSHLVVEELVDFFPNAIWSTNGDGHNIIQYAVITRSEKVYNLLYQIHKNINRTMKDSCDNNLLHLAARLAPTNKLNLISGAALQIQRELRWFKEVENFVCPLSIIQKNAFNETPHMIFTREHKDLVIEGEKWMKATTESYTITAALITTIVFAAAITVPGGNNQETGIPLFTDHTAFTIFAISDAISLFAAVTSLLMFLSILTARYAEQDFLSKLPTKLIICLATLFISTTAMIVAFSATLYLVSTRNKSKILIPIVVPITSFVTLQFPLINDLMSAAYGRSIFGKKRDRPFY